MLRLRGAHAGLVSRGDQCAEGILITHVYRNPGPFTIGLTVVDNSDVENGSVTTTKVITVEGDQIIGIQGPDVTCPATPFDLVAAADGAPDGIRYNWLLAGGENQ